MTSKTMKDGVLIDTPDEIAAQIAADAIPSADALVAYANMRQWAVAIGGRSVAINGVDKPISTTPESQALLYSKMLRLSQPSPPTTVNWQVGTTEMVTLSPADFTMMATEIADFVQATFDALPGIFAGISAGAITAPAQIDAVLAAI